MKQLQCVFPLVHALFLVRSPTTAAACGRIGHRWNLDLTGIANSKNWRAPAPAPIVGLANCECGSKSIVNKVLYLTCGLSTVKVLYGKYENNRENFFFLSIDNVI
jgi:hypothetical protein